MFARSSCAVPALLSSSAVRSRGPGRKPGREADQVEGEGREEAVRALVTFKVKAGNEKKFEAAFAPCLVATRKEPGCVAYYLNRDPDQPRNYVMYEQFKSIAALEPPEGEAHADAVEDVVRCARATRRSR